MQNTKLYRPVAHALDWCPEDVNWIFSRIPKGEGIPWSWIDTEIERDGTYYRDCPQELDQAHRLLSKGYYSFREYDFEYARFFQIGKLSFLRHSSRRCTEELNPKPCFRDFLLHLSFGDFILFEFRLWAKYLAILKHRKSRWVKHLEFKAFGKTFIHWKSK